MQILYLCGFVIEIILYRITARCVIKSTHLYLIWQDGACILYNAACISFLIVEKYDLSHLSHP